MADIRKIMTALGLGPYSREVFAYGSALAEKTGADLVVVNIINNRDVEAIRTVASLGYEVDGEHYVHDVKAKRLSLLEEIVRASSFPREKIKTRIQVGNPADQLLKISLEEKVDLIVMGTKGRTDIEHVFIGSVAERMFRRSVVPVLFYRSEKDQKRLKNRLL